MIFTTRLIEYGKPNGNGRTYQPDHTDWPDRLIYGTIDPPKDFSIPVADIVASARVFERPDGVWGEITPVRRDEDLANLFEQMVDNGFTVVPCGAGRIEDGVVKDFRLISFFLTREPS